MGGADLQTSKPRTSKPALLYWFRRLVSTIRVHEFSALLPSVPPGDAVLLTYELGRRMFSRVSAWLAASSPSSRFRCSFLAHAATPTPCYWQR